MRLPPMADENSAKAVKTVKPQGQVRPRSRRFAWFKTAFRLGLTLLVSSVLGLVLLIGGYIVLAWPGTDDQLQLAGLKAPVIIQHDDAGVVHLQAAYRRDAWFALGALHA
ncbi:MAG: hypothetical protein FJY62_10910, partial [Betaproteobacteria bacterium]|nr:hypothetical protein [Betaproteobacteria bacterium]